MKFLKAGLVGYILRWRCEAKLLRGNHTIPLFLKAIKSPFWPEIDQEYTRILSNMMKSIMTKYFICVFCIFLCSEFFFLQFLGVSMTKKIF